MEPSDAELLDRWQKGSREAGKQLFERYYETLERFFVNKVPSGIGDLVHETFQMCLEARDRIEDPDKFRSYLFSIAYNVLRGRFRKQGRRGEEIDLEDVTVEALAPGPRSILVEQEEQRLLLEGLRRIPVADQVLLELYYWESLKVAEIAEILEIPLGTAKRRLHHARKRLEEVMGTLAAAPSVLSSTLADLDAWARKCRREQGRSSSG
ncbi:MAG TPA: sigma-70 family RNA polymerase sigma factor [Kofleriaceae bacterium]|nr:sigma-70 family RNA polymerase sigma factor [Kofleriaceae bacterium]